MNHVKHKHEWVPQSGKPYDLCATCRQRSNEYWPLAEDIPAGYKRCQKCVNLVPIGHVLCDWCAAKHIGDQLKPIARENGGCV